MENSWAGASCQEQGGHWGPRPAGRKEQVEREDRREAGSWGDELGQRFALWNQLHPKGRRRQRSRGERRSKAFRLAALCLRATIFTLPLYVCQLTVCSPDAWDVCAPWSPFSVCIPLSAD